MSRTTNQQYLAARHWLRVRWDDNSGVYAELEYAEQCCLHNYFKPVSKLTDEAAVAHRKTVSALHPSLPQRAGRTLVKLRAVHQAHAEQLALVSTGPVKTTQKNRRIVIKV